MSAIVKNSTPVNKDAQDCVKNVMKFLAEISGEKIVTGQHTQECHQAELVKIKEVTGKEPALLGFELLSYSPNINYLDTDDDCMKEVRDNRGTLEQAWEWAAKKGLITFTWHWFSPLSGRSKSFFSANTDFDAEKAATPGTKEYEAMISDIDYMSGLLRPFCEANIPILWRPFHECEGDWFWWGAKGGAVAAKLFRIMYDRMTNTHHLNNLIWVFNSPLKESYPGDDVVDIVTRDMYPTPHDHSSFAGRYNELVQITEANKIIAIGETGVLPDPEAVAAENIGWSYYMTWSHEFCLTEDHTTNEFLKKAYNSEHAITKENLPELF